MKWTEDEPEFNVTTWLVSIIRLVTILFVWEDNCLLAGWREEVSVEGVWIVNNGQQYSPDIVSLFRRGRSIIFSRYCVWTYYWGCPCVSSPYPDKYGMLHRRTTIGCTTGTKGSINESYCLLSISPTLLFPLSVSFWTISYIFGETTNQTIEYWILLLLFSHITIDFIISGQRMIFLPKNFNGKENF